MYYQISPTGYPVISPIPLEGFIQYDEANKPQELIDALILQAQVDAEAESKQAKLLAMESITVTTASGKVFDGRDKDQARMLSAIQASDTLVKLYTEQYNAIAAPTQAETDAFNASIVGVTTTMWKLNDNTSVEITLDELKEAQALAIQAMGAIIVGG